DLAAGPRYLMTFDAPWGAIEFGRRFAALRDQPELARSGLVAQVSGYVALGLADSARAAARELRGGGPGLNVFAPDLGGALLLVDADCAEGDARWAELSRALAEHARSRASTDATRRRAAWMLLLLARHCGAHADSAPYVRMVTGESGRRPLAGVLAADALARAGHGDLALAATDPLTTLQADSLGDPVDADPFFRSVLHLLRAGWHERRHDVAGAVAGRGPVIGCRTRGPVSVEVDGAGAPTELMWRKNIALVVYLARSPKRARPRDHLIGVFWGDKPQDDARHSLNQAVGTLRPHMGEGGLDSDAAQVRLNPGAVQLDVDQLE